MKAQIQQFTWILNGLEYIASWNNVRTHVVSCIFLAKPRVMTVLFHQFTHQFGLHHFSLPFGNTLRDIFYLDLLLFLISQLFQINLTWSPGVKNAIRDTPVFVVCVLIVRNRIMWRRVQQEVVKIYTLKKGCKWASEYNSGQWSWSEMAEKHIVV